MEIDSKYDVSQLQYLNFNTSNPGMYFSECQDAYRLWKETWLFTYAELGVNKKLTSEDFLNRHVCGLFKDRRAIGFLLHHELNLSLNSALDSNYFQSYPQSLIQYQKVKSDHAFIVSFMSIDNNWRKSKTNFSISELLLSFAVLEFNFTECRRILGYFRNNRSINDIFYRHGGHFLCRDIAHNIEVDFGEIHKSKSQLSQHKDHAILSFRLWNAFYNKHKQEIEHGFKNNSEPRKNEYARREFSFSKVGQQGIL
jgi:hypothetical protein